MAIPCIATGMGFAMELQVDVSVQRERGGGPIQTAVNAPQNGITTTADVPLVKLVMTRGPQVLLRSVWKPAQKAMYVKKLDCAVNLCGSLF